MRIMLKAQIPVETGNMSMQDGSLAQVLQEAATSLKPEACYFFAQDGCRTAMYVFDMQDTSQIPAIAEPLFSKLNARISFEPVMNLDDLRKGMQILGGSPE